MAVQSALKSIDLQKVVSGAAELEVKALLAGVECAQVWISQAAKLANIASDTLQAIQNDKGSLSATVRRLTDFGKQNAQVFGDLSNRMSKSYYDELDRLAKSVTSSPEKQGSATTVVKRSVRVKAAVRRKSSTAKKALRKV